MVDDSTVATNKKEGKMKRAILTLVIILTMASFVQADFDVKDMTPKMPVYRYDLTSNALYAFEFTSVKISRVTVTKEQLSEMLMDHMRKVAKQQQDMKKKYNAEQKELKELRKVKIKEVKKVEKE